MPLQLTRELLQMILQVVGAAHSIDGGGGPFRGNALARKNPSFHRSEVEVNPKNDPKSASGLGV